MENPIIAVKDHSLVGDWKLISSQVIVDDQVHDLFGSSPKGYLILTPQRRLCAITIAEHRKPGEGDLERAALHRSMLAYTGKYRVEGSDFVTVVDASWNEVWNGTEQRRHFRIEGDQLFIESAPAPSILFPGRVDFRRIVWQREK
jgi:Lipocalin-like domain